MGLSNTASPICRGGHPEGAIYEGGLELYFRDIAGSKGLSRDEEIDLGRRIRQGDEEAMHKLVAGNLRFVVSVAKKYTGQGVAMADLINEGNVGLMRAARKFDPERGIKFITYAVWWIRQAILQLIAEQSRVVRLPINQNVLLHRVRKQKTLLGQSLGREPSAAEIAEALGLPETSVADSLKIDPRQVSLDAPVSEGRDARFIDLLASGDRAADEDLYSRALEDLVEHALATLKDREAKIIRLYYGFDGLDPMTLEQIGQIFGITRERVRQIKEKALERLRHASRSKALSAFAND